MQNHDRKPSSNRAPFDALLILSYGGPEGPEEVRPFLKNVLHGRNVPERQFEAIAAKYHAVGGASPVNEECRALIGGLLRGIDEGLLPADATVEPRVEEIFAEVRDLPIYWGNLFWHPLLEDTIAGMAKKAFAGSSRFAPFLLPRGTVTGATAGPLTRRSKRRTRPTSSSGKRVRFTITRFSFRRWPTG